jgi:hypothetical protein
MHSAMTTNDYVDLGDLFVLSDFSSFSNEEKLSVEGSHSDPNNETDVKKIIRDYISPGIERDDLRFPGSKNHLRSALGRMLAAQGTNLVIYRSPPETVSFFGTRSGNGPIRVPVGVEELEGNFEAGEAPFNLPSDPLNYYRWAWDVIFPGEDYGATPA